ncbi:MAG: DUF1822 family protein [Gloeocapsa sp. DLM2.Bin57]|nr:MAG: DUF1822 family protein [Gloeocapsa sp. DLM2.Bin57]
MNINFDYFLDNPYLNQQPQPGEIWEISKDIYNPIRGTSHSLKTATRYLMIVDKIDEHLYQGIVISESTEFSSDVDLIIPAAITGTSQDLLVETWHLIEVLDCHLICKVGNRLSRQVYDLLLDLYLEEVTNNSMIASLGLRKGNQSKNLSFYQQEKAWGELINRQVQDYLTYQQAVNLTNQIVAATINNEQELNNLNSTVTLLSQWLEDNLTLGWQKLTDLVNTQEYQLSYALRSEIETTAIQNLKTLTFGKEIIAIIMTIQPENHKLAINLEIIPQVNQRYLPENLQVNILDSDGEMLKSLQTRKTDNCLKLPKMKLAKNNEFILEVILGETKISEKFSYD